MWLLDEPARRSPSQWPGTARYKFDPTLNGGDWAFVKQVDFGQSAGGTSS
jgi:hypothetical protein